MAAEVARAAGAAVDLYDAKGSVGRKVLIAGKGGLNLTHSEPDAAFRTRFGDRSAQVGRWLDGFGPAALRAWAAGLGVQTIIGSSGRVFPSDLRAAPLLRGWVRRLREQGVQFHVQHHWRGWEADGALRFDTPTGPRRVVADAVLLALGGGSWPELGSDGAWQSLLADRGVPVTPLSPSNCGFELPWSERLQQRAAGLPLKPVVAHWQQAGDWRSLQGEAVITRHGLEGSLLYAISVPLRAQLRERAEARLWLDLAPGRDLARLQADLSVPRGRRTLAEHLRRRAGLDAGRLALLLEHLHGSAASPAAAIPAHAGDRAAGDDAQRLAATIKRLPLRILATRPLAEAISSDGGVRFDALDARGMLRALPGVFCAGEMIDWDAPTGGYLLTACMASGRHAALGALSWLAGRTRGH